MRNIFEYRDNILGDYQEYVESFISISNPAIREFVQQQFNSGVYWPEPLIQVNPLFQSGKSVQELAAEGVLLPACADIFQRDGHPMRLHKHQEEAIRTAAAGGNYILTTGVGSGKSLAYIIPIVQNVLKHGSGQGVRAVIVYPLNALANSQMQELDKFLKPAESGGKPAVTFRRYTGQENSGERDEILQNPPDILLTNYVMLELILTRFIERNLLRENSLKFLVFDELHTYRGRQGADIAMLARRVKNRCGMADMQFIGTSATLVSEGTWEQQRQAIAKMGAVMFGSETLPEHIIGETLERITPQNSQKITAAAIQESLEHKPNNYTDFINHPFSGWIEAAFGVAVSENEDRLTRAKPISAQTAAQRLSAETGADKNVCLQAIQEWLLHGYSLQNPITNTPVFAFRLHQFISKGNTVYASLDEHPYLTLYEQVFVPDRAVKDNKEKDILLPLVFCRECGQEYYNVFRKDVNGKISYAARPYLGKSQDENEIAGFLFPAADSQWPDLENADITDLLPDQWLEEFHGSLRIRSSFRKTAPRFVQISANGKDVTGNYSGDTTFTGYFFPAPFRFCMKCGVEYTARKRDFSRIHSLSSEGRSSATTVLSISAMRHIDKEDSLARKMLSFTDNRQDASLQAGHFNDFIEVGLLRAAIWRAVNSAGLDGVTHEHIARKVVEALKLPEERYAADPNVKYNALEETNKALRDVIGYRVYIDMQRGWRVTLPNLEQCGLLDFTYQSLEDICNDNAEWQGCHPALVAASPERRRETARNVLHFMRRSLAIKVDYLTRERIEAIQQNSSQRLKDPWAFDENEKIITAKILFPRSGSADTKSRTFLFAGPRSALCRYIRRQLDPTDVYQKNEAPDMLLSLLQTLAKAGITEAVYQNNDIAVPGFQIPAAAIIWRSANGEKAMRDPIYTPNKTDGERAAANTYFVKFYREAAEGLTDLCAYEHTAQSPADVRMEREKAFRCGKLPILYCSPTMELGIDIAELQVVNMRNAPPTPANYAQRSGRAGRSGQPAFVFTYCSTGSPHDQYFFRRPDLLVKGVVEPPQIDIANEDLVRSHIHAIWLAETQLKLPNSLKDLLDMSGEQPSLKVIDRIQESLNDLSARKHAESRARAILLKIPEILRAEWYSDTWLNDTMAQIAIKFEAACDRWRTLYLSALNQSIKNHKISIDASCSQQTRSKAEQLDLEAKAQIKLLLDENTSQYSDFYSYRYFATEGFLPGYNFPRLPLSAFIGGRRQQKKDDTYLQRPRFLAISEFGPQSIVYHEGARYRVDRVIMQLDSAEELLTRRAKICSSCGYLHPIEDDSAPDCCEYCGAVLPASFNNLFRMRNVTLKRDDKIFSDEEERQRRRFEIISAVRFAKDKNGSRVSHSDIVLGAERLATLDYAHSASLWRMNIGERRSAGQESPGFVLDRSSGRWVTQRQQEQMNIIEEDDEIILENSIESSTMERVVPYVEDTRNSLIFTPERPRSEAAMVSLAFALKHAIQIYYQLEDSELSVELLPNSSPFRRILFYESSEGGAGALRRIHDDPGAIAGIARAALDVCHFNPDTGEDIGHAITAQENCVAACYNCLMTYYNQYEHTLLDRHSIQTFLLNLSRSTVNSSPTGSDRQSHFNQLLLQCDSELEKTWLQEVFRQNLNLPLKAQPFIEGCNTRPDFLYDGYTAVYIDGPHHEFADIRQKDAEVTACLEDSGYIVIRFTQNSHDWQTVFDAWPNIFKNSR